jgi:Nuclease-related domain
MRVVLLSDHPGDLLRQARQRGSKQYQRAMAEYRSAIRRHEAEVRRAEAARDQARAAHHWLTWLRGVFAVRRARRRAPTLPQRVGAPTDEESKLAAGVEGEQFVADELGRALGDDWALFRGYKNSRGEVDHLLLGPKGLVAIEVKNINGTVHCEGDSWRVDKYDQYGNLVEQYSLGDRGARHRSPSVQLNEPVDALEEFLRSRGQDVGVLRVVLLAHPRSKIGTCRRATVNIFTRTSEVTRLVTKVKQPFDAATRAKLEDLIIRDHRHHARRRR